MKVLDWKNTYLDTYCFTMETITRNLEDLLAFHMVASAHSFTRAAEELGTSKAMVSKQISRLETYMKTKLFLRTTRSLSLTPEGDALFEYSKKVIGLTDEASKRLRDMGQGTSGLIRFSAPVSLGEIIFPTLLRLLSKALPDVHFDFDVSNEVQDFQAGKVDFAFRATNEHHPDLVARDLGRIKDVICASPAYLKRNALGNDLKDLAKHNCILHSLDPSWNEWMFSSADKDFRVDVTGAYTTNQYPMARLFCLDGLGILRTPLYLVADDIANGQLVRLFPEYSISTHPLYLIYLRNEYATLKHGIVKKIILSWISENSEFFQKSKV